MFKYDDDKFVKDIQAHDDIFYQCVEIINEKIARILWASKTLLGYSDDFYQVKKEVNFNYQSFRSTYSILSAIFRYRLNRLSLFENDKTKIQDIWKDWIRTEIDKWFDNDPRFIKTFLRFSNEKEININMLNERLLDKYNEIPWNKDVLDEFFDDQGEDMDDEDLGPYCICFKKNRSPCGVLPCITMSEENAKKEIFLD